MSKKTKRSTHSKNISTSDTNNNTNTAQTTYLKTCSRGTILLVHIQPNSSKSEIKGLHGERIKIRISSPPVEGEANQTLIDFLSKFFNKPKNQIEIIRGAKSRTKDVLISDISVLDIQKKLNNS